jgi:hypothetical protein
MPVYAVLWEIVDPRTKGPSRLSSAPAVNFSATLPEKIYLIFTEEGPYAIRNFGKGAYGISYTVRLPS